MTVAVPLGFFYVNGAYVTVHSLKYSRRKEIKMTRGMPFLHV